MAALLQTEYAIKVGDWVEVLCEYAPGTCSDGGVGSIVKIERDADERTWCTVSFTYWTSGLRLVLIKIELL
jgi:hypothetical protein